MYNGLRGIATVDIDCWLLEIGHIIGVLPSIAIAPPSRVLLARRIIIHRKIISLESLSRRQCVLFNIFFLISDTVFLFESLAVA